MFYTIYKITNQTNGKFYIGKHQTKNLQDGYMGSGKLIKAAIKKYGIENFTKEILHVFDTEEEMNQAEKELVVIGEESYNLCEGGKGGFGYINDVFWDKDKRLLHNKTVSPFSADFFSLHKDKILENGKKGIELARSSQRKKYPNGTFFGKSHSIESKQKMSLSHQGLQTKELNSQYGTCWITNGTENKKIKKDDLDNWISLGYYKGRTMERVPDRRAGTASKTD